MKYYPNDERQPSFLSFLTQNSIQFLVQKRPLIQNMETISNETQTMWLFNLAYLSRQPLLV